MRWCSLMSAMLLDSLEKLAGESSTHTPTTHPPINLPKCTYTLIILTRFYTHTLIYEESFTTAYNN